MSGKDTKGIRRRKINIVKILEKLDKDYNKPPMVYEFSNGRKFTERDPYENP